ncbi:MAG: WD40-repeat-containing domain protein [Benniella sp.]|nr:MAG: WD40-repeat-containing domain protein [Benniella sp.]
MVFGGIISSPRSSLSAQQSLEMANAYLENATKATDPDIMLVYCHDIEVSLSQAKKGTNHDVPTVREGIAAAYIDLGRLLQGRGHNREAQASFKKAEKLGGNVNLAQQSAPSSRPSSIAPSIKSSIQPTPSTRAATPSQPPSNQYKPASDIATVPQEIFPVNLRPPSIAFNPPEPDTRLDDTPQLASCLGLLQTDQSPDDITDHAARNWLQVTKNDEDEKERLKTLATDVVRAFKRDELKDASAVTEVVHLASVLAVDDYRYLVREFYSGIDQSGLLDIHQLEGLARLTQEAEPGYLEADDLVKILELLSSRLQETHIQSSNHVYKLTLAVSHVLDAMADASVKDLDRKTLHEPLSLYLDGLRKSADSYLVYQAAYAFQALLCVPDDETLWQKAFRRTGKVIKGVSGLVSAVKGLDLNGFMDGLIDIQKGMAGVSEIYGVVKSAYEGVTSLAESGQGFFDSLNEGLTFHRQCAWYSALRGADSLLREGQFANFRVLVCEAPCRRDPAFQWGICQRLGEIAANTAWDSDTRQDAVAFLGEIYQHDTVWGDQISVKQWILSILMQLCSLPEMDYANALLQSFAQNKDAKKQELFKVSIKDGPGHHPMRIALPPLASPSLLDRVQNRPDVEGNLRLLRRHRSKEKGSTVFIPPQAKASIQSPDDTRFPLMEKVREFLDGDQTVFLLLGESGAGKSTFNSELESQLWQEYKGKTGVIPLHINLPGIEKPEHDMIAKQLRKSEFTEPEIRELKLRRKFILICDGYDESQQTHNLYVSNRLNEPGNWQAKMIVSCRNEYLGIDYRDRFQPGDRNNRTELGQFQEAVITPFSPDQVEDYINQYVIVQQPIWEASEYKRALHLIPSLMDLVKNPFLMTLSLEVLPRIVDPGQNLSTTQVSRVSLYDQFIVHWLERGKKRLGEKELSPLAKAAFESLIDEGFTQNGIDFLKKLAVAIYKEQGGQPVVRYSRFKDEKTWKTAFFSREDEKQLLREACPLTRSGNQHRFIHRSLLEYGLSLAVFDPRDWKDKSGPQQVSQRRGSTSSSFSFRIDGTAEVAPAPVDLKPDANSPLAWRYFLNDPSVIQFLSERAQQEPVFKQQLYQYIELSKKEEVWRRAAANAITILVRAGEQFNGADLRGIRIPGADLSNGMFDSAQFEGADLRQTTLRGAWLRQADLSKAKMTSAQFGELPFISMKAEVSSCAYSPDGKALAVGLCNNEIILYSTSTWEILRPLTGHTKGVRNVVYSPKGDHIASGSSDTTARIWDVDAGSTLHELSGHEGPINQVAYSPQGDMVASASDDKTVRIWNFETGDCCLTLSGHEATVKSVMYSPKGNVVASGGDDSTARLWDVTTGDCIRILKGDHRQTFSLTFSPIGDILAVASDSDVVLWDVATGTKGLTLSGHPGMVVESLSYSPQGNLIASASSDSTVRLWDTENGTCLHSFTGHSSGTTSVVFAPKENRLATGGRDKKVRLWDVRAVSSHNVSVGPSDEALEIKYSPQSDQIATRNSDDTIRLWNTGSGSCLRISKGHDGAITSIVFSPHGDLLVSASTDSTLKSWDTETGKNLATFTGHSEGVNVVAFSHQNGQVASGSKDHTVRLWNTETGDCTHTLAGHTDSVVSIAYSPQGHQLASASEDKTVRLWKTENSDCQHTLTGHTDKVVCVVYSPEREQVASASLDFTVKLWDATTGDCSRTFSGVNSDNPRIVYSPQGHQVHFTIQDSAEARLWNVDTGECSAVLTGHSYEVVSAAYSPKGHLIATGSRDNSMRVWDVTSGQCRAVVSDFNSSVRKIVWYASSEVDYLVTACHAGSVRLWRVVEDENSCRVHLCWSSRAFGLTATNASVQDVHGLSLANKQLLKQLGAIGEPAVRLREATKKLIGVMSLASKLKQPSVKTIASPTPSTVAPAIEQSEQVVDK